MICLAKTLIMPKSMGHCRSARPAAGNGRPKRPMRKPDEGRVPGYIETGSRNQKCWRIRLSALLTPDDPRESGAPMKPTVAQWLSCAGGGLLLAGCISHQETVYRDVERERCS